MLSNMRSGLLLLAGLAAPAAAWAAPVDPWFVHVGGARMATDEAVKATLLGSPLAGADLDLAPRYAAAVEVGRYLAPTLAVSVSAGSPVRQRVAAAGSIRALGTLGRVTYGPAAATLHWHPLPQARVRPYIGGGVAYLHVFHAGDGALARFRLHDDAGPVVQGGAELMVGRHFGLFADAKKAWLTSSTGGLLGAAPVTGRARLDPVVLSAGAAFRF